jgi:hypothetical protein
MKGRPETPYANDFITAAGREYDRSKCDDPLRSRGGFQVLSGFSESASLLEDVMAIEQIGPATSQWRIQGPLGIRAHWAIKVTKERPNELIRYETVAHLD